MTVGVVKHWLSVSVFGSRKRCLQNTSCLSQYYAVNVRLRYIRCQFSVDAPYNNDLQFADAQWQKRQDPQSDRIALSTLSNAFRFSHLMQPSLPSMWNAIALVILTECKQVKLSCRCKRALQRLAIVGLVPLNMPKVALWPWHSGVFSFLIIGGGTTEPSDFGPLKITLWITMIISGMYILHWVYYTLAAG